MILIGAFGAVVGDLWLGIAPCPLHHCNKTVVLISRVLHNTRGAVSLLQRVGALNHVAIPGLPLVLHVSGVGVVYSIFKLVLWMSLQQKRPLS